MKKLNGYLKKFYTAALSLFLFFIIVSSLCFSVQASGISYESCEDTIPASPGPIDEIVIGREEVVLDSSSVLEYIEKLAGEEFSLSYKGNSTLIDDYISSDDKTEEHKDSGKEFITLETKSGNVFYLIIDRDGEKENVYFLNLVDERDLFSLMEKEEIETLECSCVFKCTESESGDCALCRYDNSLCHGKEKLIIEEPEDEIKEEKDNNKYILPAILLLTGGGIAVYYFVSQKKMISRTMYDE